MTNNENVNDIINDLCKQYQFEYGVYLEKIKVHEEFNNELTANSIEISIQNINNIKEKILGILLGEITMDENGNIGTGNNSQEKNKTFFKMEF